MDFAPKHRLPHSNYHWSKSPWHSRAAMCGDISTAPARLMPLASSALPCLSSSRQLIETLYPAPCTEVPPSAALPLQRSGPEQMISISPCIWDPVHLRNGNSIPGNFSNQTAQATPLQVEALEIHPCIEGESESDSPKPRSVTLAAVTEL